MDQEQLAHARQDALAFLKHHKAGVLATVSAEGAPHATTVYYVCDEDFNIYILTLANSRKFAAIQAHPEVAFTVSVPDVPQAIQIEGIASDISMDEGVKHKRQELFGVLSSNNWFYGPITKMDPADAMVVWIRPTWVRWSDYAFAEAGNSNVLIELPLKDMPKA